MNDFVISTIYKNKSYLNCNKKKEINPKQQFQIVKLNRKNKIDKKLDSNNELKISSHYIGEIDKNNFGITTTKINKDLMKKIERHKEILNILSNKEIHLKSYINCFKTPQNKNNDTTFKFNKINFPQYRSTPILEEIKFPLSKKNKNIYNSLIVNSFYYKRQLKKNFYKDRFERIKIVKSVLSKREKIVDDFDNKFTIERHNTFNTINNDRKLQFYKLNSSSNSNKSSFIKTILSKNTSKPPYELKNKQTQTKYLCNDDSFSSGGDSKSPNNSYFKTIFIKSKKNLPVSLKKIFN